MQYPIVILMQKYEELDRELERISKTMGPGNPGRNVPLAIVRITKYKNDLSDAINHLEKLSTVDENHPAPKKGDEIKYKKE